MYLPDQFKECDVATIRELVDDFPLAVLVAQGGDGLIANHIPVIFESDSTVIGHVAGGNDLHRAIADSAEVMLIFKGEDAYISPNWYPSKPRHHRHVPTWNYQIVHIHGRISFHHDERRKRAIVGRMTKLFEDRTNGQEAWRMADAPGDYMTEQLANIVGFSVEIDRIVGKSKLSQNRDIEDAQNVCKELDLRGYKAMPRRMKDIFGD